DGKNVLFISQRSTFTNRYLQLFTVPVTGGFPSQLDIPNAYYASYSPDGKSMAYTPIADRFQEWKNYRGGTISTVWIISFGDHSVVQIPKPAEGCNDTDPVWIGDKIYFMSDRNGEFNLFSFDSASRQIKQLTSFTDFPVLSIGADNDRIIFEQAGYLHLFDPATSASGKLTVAIATDLQELRPRYVSGGKYIRGAGISPTGARAVFDFRGEIITVPAEKGDPRNITQTAGVHEKYPAWSPDGNYIAYFSDSSGEYKLYIQPQDGKSEARTFSPQGTGFYGYPKWSPDSKKITFVDNGRNLYLLDVASGIISRIDSDELYRPGDIRDMMNDWSSDSRWFVYTRVTKTFFECIYLYSLEQGKSFKVTDGLSDASEPVFDRGGRYLYFFASTDAGPVNNWFDQSAADMRATRSIYLLTLQKDTISPFAKESDEEKAGAEPAIASKAAESSKKDKKAPAETAKPEKIMKIDLEGIQDRIVAFPVDRGNYRMLGSGKNDEVLYIVSPAGSGAQATLHKYDLKKRKDSEVMEMDGYMLSADGKKMLYSKRDTWGIAPSGEKPEAGKGMLNTSDIQVKIEPLAEWPQIFDEAWRINRDYFYDPGMHGADWKAMKARYAVFLPDLACRSDLNRLIQWMCSELSVGHHRVGGGDLLNSPATVKGGLLGADYELINNRYRLKKIYGGLNWNPGMRSPLTEPGINARVGDYILAVNGKDVKSDRNLFSFFENTAGRIVELTIGPNPDYTGSRVVKVVPVENESSLRNRDWVEGNLKKVTEATNGQVAYVYVPNTAGDGHEYFKRYFFPQADRKAIIIDERFNGGGLIADYYIDILRKPYQSYWNMRYGIDLKTPSASIQGPKVMIIDETAGSGGDMLPWMFRKFE
ncbi:MAG: PDZ domain-containing protein, partial [Bacteroidales bacterium]|nr:PDZ domain-containing protein [Bacteroidales bacterium]